MQKKKVVWAGIISLFVIVALGGLISACFSPWKGDMGAFSISIGNSGSGGSSRAVLPWDDSIDSNDLQHVIKLSGAPGPDQTRTITGSGTVNFTVTPGNWYISVEAYSVDNTGESAPTGGGQPVKTFVAFGARDVNIKSGLNGTVSMEMWQVVSNWSDLGRVIEAGGSTIALGAYVYFNWEFWDNTITINRPVTLIAANNIDITRLSGLNSFFSIGQEGSLTLQAARGRTLIIDGGGEANSGASSLVSVDGGELVMNDGVKLFNNYVTDYYGGGVSVNGGVFTMNSGSAITGNTAVCGGGVYVSGGDSDGTFIMKGGTISGNTASESGGGVYVDGAGNFTKTGGTIYGSDGGGNANMGEPGQAVYVRPIANASTQTFRTEKQRDTTGGTSVNLDSDSETWPK